VPSTFEPRNNFDLLRLLFAGAVFLAHVGHLSGQPTLAWLPAVFHSDTAVQGFFVLSGFLIVMSYERSTGLRQYVSNRVRRIYPAYAAVVLLAALIGAVVSTRANYWSDGGLAYGFWNLLFLNFIHPTLPGLFEHQVLSAVNGALWTLKIEVMFYAAVPLIVWMTRRFPFATIGGTYTLSTVYFYATTHLAAVHPQGIWLEVSRQLPGQIRYFIGGVALYYFFDLFRKNAMPIAVAAVALWSIAAWLGGEQIVRPMCLAIVVIYAGTCIPYLGNAARFGDSSYGVYILHFPILQTAVAAGLFDQSPVLAFCACFVAVATGSLLLWHAVEKPSLRRTSHYRQES